MIFNFMLEILKFFFPNIFYLLYSDQYISFVKNIGIWQKAKPVYNPSPIQNFHIKGDGYVTGGLWTIGSIGLK
jgi:hypothetical protein